MMDKELQNMAKSIVTLQNEAVKQTLLIWKPKAEHIIINKSRDIEEIEHTLDALCEVAFNDEILRLFKKLCRYYYNIDPVATVEYIQFYREMWDKAEEEKNDE